MEMWRDRHTERQRGREGERKAPVWYFNQENACLQSKLLAFPGGPLSDQKEATSEDKGLPSHLEACSRHVSTGQEVCWTRRGALRAHFFTIKVL